MKKKYTYWICSVFFLICVVLIIWFLHLFTQTSENVAYINWETSLQIGPDGSTRPFTSDITDNTTEISGTYCFTGTLPEGLPSGSLVFETSGLDLSLSLDGKVVWQSRAEDDNLLMAQAVIPLPEGTSGELSVTCTPLEGTTPLFPPVVRFQPDSLEAAQATAFANRDALPAGAAALAFLLVLGIFLSGLIHRQTNWSLLPLLFVLGGITSYRLIQGQGYYFFSQDLYQIFSRREFEFAILLGFLLYLVMNRRRPFWKAFGLCTACSAGAFLICYLVSLAAGSGFAVLVNELAAQIPMGYYDGAVYWVIWWLSLVCAIIAAYEMARAYADQRAQAQSALLKSRMLTEHYHTMERQMEESAERQHEINHQLTSLECMLREHNYGKMEQFLSQVQNEQSRHALPSFTDNTTVNIILQDAYNRAKQKGINFKAAVQVPPSLNIPEPDLCTLLINMLDNALEAAEKVHPPKKRFLSVHMRISRQYLALKCKNAYDGTIRKDKKGNLLSTKPSEDPVSPHGFGCRKMLETAKRYHSTVNFYTMNDSTFIAETALRIPD